MSQPSPGKGTILIIDDDPNQRNLLTVLFTQYGYQVQQASRGSLGFEMAHELLPDLILLDIMMPGDLDGFDVCRLLKKDPDTKDIYIIMLTAKGQKTDKEKGLALGADDYFVKPFSPMELMDKIDKILA